MLRWEKAWRQRCYRKANKSKRQVNFSLDRLLIEDLKELAKYRGVTNTQVVSQLIGDAARQMRNEKVKERTRRKEYQDNLKNLKSKYENALDAYREVILGLSRELDDLLPDACRAKLLRESGGDDAQVSEAAVANEIQKTVALIRCRNRNIGFLHFLRKERPFSRVTQEDT